MTDDQTATEVISLPLFWCSLLVDMGKKQAVYIYKKKRLAKPEWGEYNIHILIFPVPVGRG